MQFFVPQTNVSLPFEIVLEGFDVFDTKVTVPSPLCIIVALRV